MPTHLVLCPRLVSRKRSVENLVASAASDRGLCEVIDDSNGPMKFAFFAKQLEARAQILSNDNVKQWVLHWSRITSKGLK